MEKAGLVHAIDVLMSPLEWGSQEAWLAEGLRGARDVCGEGWDLPADPLGGLQALLRLPGDQPEWLRAALDSAGGERRSGALPPMAEVPPALLLVVSLRCALGAGLVTLQRLGTWRTTLGQAFDDVGSGMVIFGADGLREVARNARLDELLGEEPERVRLRDAIARQARQAAGTEGCPREEDREIDLAGGSYRLIASRAVAGTLLPEAAVLVLLDRLSSGLPTTQELRISFGLRGREPQIALLAAEGLSNAAIAERLRLSAHTVRHYLERVLYRLGLHSRKALALHLMAGGGERPPPPDRKPA
ncbi:MAG TPA: helix-turn-helix transcriptional regulator [Gemmatimonadales bacterium]